jgi:hypothetical protein
MENLNIFNRKELKQLRSSLRKKSTSAEATLWEMKKSTTPAASKLCFIIISIVLRPPLLQKEGKVKYYYPAQNYIKIDPYSYRLIIKIERISSKYEE